jgi:hypothetical protein
MGITGNGAASHTEKERHGIAQPQKRLLSGVFVFQFFRITAQK